MVSKILNVLLALSGIALAVWSLIMWSDIGFSLSSRYSDRNNDDAFFFLMLAIGVAATFYFFGNVSITSSQSSVDEGDEAESREGVVDGRQEVTSLKRKGQIVRAHFLYALMLSIGVFWFFDYRSHGFFRSKGGWPIEGWQAILCIVSIIVLPTFGLFWSLVSYWKESRMRVRSQQLTADSVKR